MVRPRPRPRQGRLVAVRQKKRRLPLNSTTAVPIKQSLAMRFTHQTGDRLKGRKLLAKFPDFARSTVFKHAKLPLDGSDLIEDRRIGSGIGRPSKLSALDRKNIKKAIYQLREEVGMFNSRRVACEAAVEQKVCNRTVRRAMKKHGFKWANARRKGQLSMEDEKARLRWARSKVRDGVTQEFWNHEVSLYMDAVGFVFKTNPYDQARAPKGKVWRLASEGLARNCTAKLNKAGTVQVKFMVGISYDRGVVLCESYKDLNGVKFSKMMDACLPQAFNLSINPYSRLYLQDGCPIQNSAIAQEILGFLNAKLVSIPARSPDLNPIENLFHLVGREVERDSIARKLTSQTIEEFEERVRNIIVNFDTQTINRCIGNMDRRIREVIRRKGGRTAY